MKTFKEYILEGKMKEIHSELEQILNRDIKKYKKNGGDEWIASRLTDAAKKISKEYGISVEDATTVVNDYFDEAMQ
jgi:ATP-dependent Lon protease